MLYLRHICLLISVITLSSCQNESSIRELSGDGYTIIPEDVEISAAKVVEWKVGEKRQQEVSKGIKIAVNLPRFDEGDFRDVLRESGADSWLLQVYRANRNGRKSLMGSIYSPIGEAAAGTSRKTVFAVYYAAASMSKRFERFKCPAFNHNKLLESAEIKEHTPDKTSISVTVVDNKRYPGPVERSRLGLTTFNGGKTLEGLYFIQMALYNASEKRIKSSFYELPQHIVASGEKTQAIDGCAGFRPPPEEEESGNPLFSR